MIHDPNITYWLEQLKQDSSTAAGMLWDVYFRKLVQIASKHLPRNVRQMADGEDVALSAFKSFCLGMQQGRFEHLVNRDSLWPLLVAITLNKARQTVRKESRQKRGGDWERQELWEDILSEGPSAEFTLQLSEQIDVLLIKLDETGDPLLRPIVLLALQGYTTKEISQQLDCALRSVQRKLMIVRRTWIEGNDD